MKVQLERVRSLRKEKKLSQKMVADLLGLHTYSYRDMEQGVKDFSLDELVILASSFDVSTDFLLGRTDMKKLYTEVEMRLIEKAEDLNQAMYEIERTLRKHNII